MFPNTPRESSCRTITHHLVCPKDIVWSPQQKQLLRKIANADVWCVCVCVCVCVFVCVCVSGWTQAHTKCTGLRCSLDAMSAQCLVASDTLALAGTGMTHTTVGNIACIKAVPLTQERNPWLLWCEQNCCVHGRKTPATTFVPLEPKRAGYRCVLVRSVW